MKILRKFKTFVNLPIATKLLFAEAFFTSAWVKASLKFFPFKRVMGWLGGIQQESVADADPQTLELRRQVKAALSLCNKYAPWPTECYTLSLTGKLLLRRRNIKSTLYIGFMKDENGKYKGHAWLRANDLYISGIKEHSVSRYTPALADHRIGFYGLYLKKVLFIRILVKPLGINFV